MQQKHLAIANIKNHSCNSPIRYTTANLPKVFISFNRATHRHANGPTVFDCSDIPANNSTILLVQFFEPLPHWFTTRSRSKELAGRIFNESFMHHTVPYYDILEYTVPSLPNSSPPAS